MKYLNRPKLIVVGVLIASMAYLQIPIFYAPPFEVTVVDSQTGLPVKDTIGQVLWLKGQLISMGPTAFEWWPKISAKTNEKGLLRLPGRWGIGFGGISGFRFETHHWEYAPNGVAPFHRQNYTKFKKKHMRNGIFVFTMPILLSDEYYRQHQLKERELVGLDIAYFRYAKELNIPVDYQKVLKSWSVRVNKYGRKDDFYFYSRKFSELKELSNPN